MQKRYAEQILDHFVRRIHICGISLFYISEARMEDVRADFKPRFERGNTIPGA